MQLGKFWSLFQSECFRYRPGFTPSYLLTLPHKVAPARPQGCVRKILSGRRTFADSAADAPTLVRYSGWPLAFAAAAPSHGYGRMAAMGFGSHNKLSKKTIEVRNIQRKRFLQAELGCHVLFGAPLVEPNPPFGTRGREFASGHERASQVSNSREGLANPGEICPHGDMSATVTGLM